MNHPASPLRFAQVSERVQNVDKIPASPSVMIDRSSLVTLISSTLCEFWWQKWFPSWPVIKLKTGFQANPSSLQQFVGFQFFKGRWKELNFIEGWIWKKENEVEHLSIPFNPKVWSRSISGERSSYHKRLHAMTRYWQWRYRPGSNCRHSICRAKLEGVGKKTLPYRNHDQGYFPFVFTQDRNWNCFLVDGGSWFFI